MAIRYVNKNKHIFEYSNIIKWHEAGYTGKGIKIANMESCNPDAWCFDGKIVDPFGNGYDKLKNSHGNQTANILHQVAPDAEIHILSNGGDYFGGKAEGSFIDVSIPYMIEEGIHLVNASLNGIDNKILNDNIRMAKDHGVIFCNSAGNSGDKGVTGYSHSGLWIVVGAVHLSKRGEVYLPGYSSRGEKLDFVQFSGLYAEDVRPSEKDWPIYQTGTSFSSPMLCGMLALVQDFFLEKTGRALNQDEIYSFILDNTIDLGEKGRDVEYGHGLFTLPNPEEINPYKYVKKTKSEEGEDIMDKFTDVNKNAWYYKAVKWAVENGILKGKSNTTFDPNAPLTRAEYAQAEYNKVIKEGK